MEFIFMLIFLIPLLYAIFHLCNLVLKWRNSFCYMLAYQCYKPSDAEARKLDTESCVKIILRNKNLGLEEYRFLLKTMVKSGLGEETYGPRSIIEGREQNPSQVDSLSEMDDIFFDTLDGLFRKTKIPPSQIDILVVNVSLFSPMPSLSSRIVNRYRMRGDIKTFNLSGMGCSGSLVAIDLVQRLFKTYSNSNAIVVSSESLGPNWYCGKEKPMILANCLYRSGGCSMLLTNKPSLKNRAILKLKSVIRTHRGSSDEAYECSLQVEDEHGQRGFRLTKNIAKVAAKALAMNLQMQVRRVLPLRELIYYVAFSRFCQSKKSNIPSHETAARGGLNLKAGIDHFCVPPTENAVINGIGKGLGLNEYDLEPVRMALHRFGNTSSGGLWYVLGYMEAKKRLKKGNKILMISFGAGYECNNCVWEVVKDLDDKNVWKECIENYPPKDVINPYVEKYGWINDEYLSFVRFD
ncbi:hypothetical protein FEM48_Zijuj03G0078700 [Ziziphus jujuba var. spinosa]|uniref:3-ketoacyl-CoA synthase n=1 Tax=Ziziphus jujuba var. spinosa TaxID=714518 RepID=A0A978VP31_ZIZJJ|nr:hypothetical protein FEM48_Zijuj03G0078700 [Ziziphus jujuba var. spinosa]